MGTMSSEEVDGNAEVVLVGVLVPVVDVRLVDPPPESLLISFGVECK